MANQEPNPPQQEQPFVVVKHVSFNLEDVLLNTNNKWYLWEVRVNTFRNDLGVNYLPYSSEYVTPSSIDIVRPWFETIGYGETFLAKGTLKKILLPPSRGTKTGAKPRHKKHLTSSKQPPVSNSEANKGGSSKAPTGSKTGYLKKKDSSSAMDSNPSQTSASTLVVAKIHKEDQQATRDPKSLGVISEESANPQLSSGYDASSDSTVEADPRLSAPNDSIPQQQGIDEGTENTSFDHISISTDPHVLAEQTKSVSEGLKIVLTQPIIGKRASSIARQVKEDEASRIIKLDDLLKLVSHVQPSFKDLDSPEDYPIIVVDDNDEDEEINKDVVYTTTNDETKDASIPKSSSLRAQPSFPNIRQLNEIMVIASKKTKDVSVPLAGQAGTQPAKGEKNTNQATISLLFQ
nr:hypothetical protein [Tanacetum cinerariifolium]